jgi:hypothetical protein
MGYLIITAILAVIGVVFTIFMSAAGKLAADECKAWAPRLTEWLIARSVTRLPEDQRDRYGEEWRSHINDIPGELSKIFWAVRYFSAARSVLPGERVDPRDRLIVDLQERLIAVDSQREQRRLAIKSRINDLLQADGPPGRITPEIMRNILLDIIDI